MSLDQLKKIAEQLTDMPEPVRRAALDAAIDSHGMDRDSVRADVAAAVADAEARVETDSAVTPGMVAILADIAAAAAPQEPAPVEPAAPTATTTDDGGDGGGGGGTDSNDSDDGGGSAPETGEDNGSVDTDQGRELVTAGAPSDAGTVEFSSQGRTRSGEMVDVTGKYLPRGRGQSAPGGSAYSAFALSEAGPGQIDTRESMGKYVADQMCRLEGRGGRSDRQLIQFRANDTWQVPRIDRKMTDYQIEEALDLAVLAANVPQSTSESLPAQFGGMSPDEAAQFRQQFANTGWCSPSVTMYDDFCGMPSLDGILSLPTVVIERGGVRYPETPSLASLFGQGVLCQTEAEAMEREEDKPCVELGCPNFIEHREGVCSLCITSSILTNRTYPEWVADQVDRLLIGYEHLMAANIITQMVEAAGDPLMYQTGAPHGATEGTLSAAEFIAKQISSQERLAYSHTIRAMLPDFVPGIIRSDLAKRNGPNMLGITDEQIAEWFRVRGIQVTWVRNWQDGLVDPDGFGSQASIEAGVWPETVQMLVWAEGAFVMGRSNVITINGLYDSALVKQNKHLQLFVEDAYAVIPRCYQARLLELPLCPNGATGAQLEYDCPSL